MLTGAISTSKTTSTHIASLFLDHWVVLCGIPNGVLHTSKLFATICALIGVKHFIKTVYHMQRRAKPSTTKKVIFTSLQNYISEHQKNWETFVQPLTYSENTQSHRSTSRTQYSLLPKRHIFRQTVLCADNVIPTEAYGKTSPQLLHTRLSACVFATRERVDLLSQKLQQPYKYDQDQRARETGIQAARFCFCRLSTICGHQGSQRFTPRFKRFQKTGVS